MRTPTLLLVTLGISAVMLSACGQKGPLYLPKVPPAIGTPAAAPASQPTTSPADKAPKAGSNQGASDKAQ